MEYRVGEADMKWRESYEPFERDGVYKVLQRSVVMDIQIIKVLRSLLSIDNASASFSFVERISGAESPEF